MKPSNQDQPPPRDRNPRPSVSRPGASPVSGTDLSGTRLGKYEIAREINRGAMGVVYLGHDPFAAKPVAIKVVNHADLTEPSQREIYQQLFFNELRAASILRHPNIASVYDAGVEGEIYYIAMEYVEGGQSLDVFCREAKLLPLETAAEVVFKCAEALDYAHRKGVIHRDVKPGNILIGQGDSVRLVDFGVALLTDPSMLDTQIMMSVGSPLYMSPEQIREGPLTNQTDLFSLGVVMYELLTGHHPFQADSLASLTYKLTHEEPPPVESLRPDLPASLARIVRKAMAKDLARRYGTALDLAADLSMAFDEFDTPRDGLETERRVDMLKRLRFFREFPDAEVWELLRWAEWRDYTDGDVILREGDAGDSFSIIISGEVRVQKDGRDLVLLGKGHSFGEMGYLADSRRTATVIAVGPVSTLMLNAQVIDRASAGCQVRFQKVFIRTLIERLAHTTELLAKAGFRRSEG